MYTITYLYHEYEKHTLQREKLTLVAFCIKLSAALSLSLYFNRFWSVCVLIYHYFIRTLTQLELKISNEGPIKTLSDSPLRKKESVWHYCAVQASLCALCSSWPNLLWNLIPR